MGGRTTVNLLCSWWCAVEWLTWITSPLFGGIQGRFAGIQPAWSSPDPALDTPPHPRRDALPTKTKDQDQRKAWTPSLHPAKPCWGDSSKGQWVRCCQSHLPQARGAREIEATSSPALKPKTLRVISLLHREGSTLLG